MDPVVLRWHQAKLMLDRWEDSTYRAGYQSLAHTTYADSFVFLVSSLEDIARKFRRPWRTSGRFALVKEIRNVTCHEFVFGGMRQPNGTAGPMETFVVSCGPQSSPKASAFHQIPLSRINEILNTRLAKRPTANVRRALAFVSSEEKRGRTAVSLLRLFRDVLNDCAGALGLPEVDFSGRPMNVT